MFCNLYVCCIGSVLSAEGVLSNVADLVREYVLLLEPRLELGDD